MEILKIEIGLQAAILQAGHLAVSGQSPDLQRWGAIDGDGQVWAALPIRTERRTFLSMILVETRRTF